MVWNGEKDHPPRWAAVSSIAGMVRCSAYTLLWWGKKSEVLHRRSPWRSFEAVEYATREWVDWFNIGHFLEPIGNIPPAEAEARYYAMLDECPMVA